MIAVANCPVFICPNSKRSPFHIIPCHRVPGQVCTLNNIIVLLYDGTRRVGARGKNGILQKECAPLLSGLCVVITSTSNPVECLDRSINCPINWIIFWQLKLASNICYSFIAIVICYWLIGVLHSALTVFIPYLLSLALGPWPAGERNISRPNVVQDLV